MPNTTNENNNESSLEIKSANEKQPLQSLRKISRYDSMSVAKPFQWAGFGFRLIAFLIDSIFMGVIWSVISFGLFSLLLSDLVARDFTTLQIEYYIDTLVDAHYFKVIIIFVLVQTLVFTLFECSKLQASPGKYAMGLIVVNRYVDRVNFKDAFARNFIKFALLVLLPVIHISILFTKKKQAIHDLSQDVFVIKKKYLSEIQDFNAELRALNSK